MRALLAFVFALTLTAGTPALPLAAVGFAASGCGSPRPVAGPSSPPASAMTDAPMGEVFEIERGASVLVEGQRLRFETVREDSRCPEGTDCVWAGRAVVAFSFIGTGTRSVGEMLLEIPGFATAETAPTPAQTVTRGAYRFTLLALDPYPGTAGAEANAQPVATLRVDRP
jgi:hypothetical protein